MFTMFVAADADRAVACGVDAIVVSNHGARQLDTVPATVSIHTCKCRA